MESLHLQDNNVTQVEQQWQMRDALVPHIGADGYRQLLRLIYSQEMMRAAGVSPQGVRRMAALRAAGQEVTAVPRQEIILESDSKSRIYVVHTPIGRRERFSLVLKAYRGSRQRLAAVEQQMNAYYCANLAAHGAVGPILAVVPLPASEPFSMAILPYLGDTTLYDHLHHLPRHALQTEVLLRQASTMLAYSQVLGQAGHEAGTIQLLSLAPESAAAYFLDQIDTAVLDTFAASGEPLVMAAALRTQFTFFAELLAADTQHAGLYYRGINPRNIMWQAGRQIDIDFEQNTVRSRFIDIVSLLENGLEITCWDDTLDYPCCDVRVPGAVWQARRRRAWEALVRYNYLHHQQVETLTDAFLDMTTALERQYLTAARPGYTSAERRVLLETARVFRHLQYVGYCKRNELQALTPAKRLSSRYRQRLHALWAKGALDNLLFPPQPDLVCLSDTGRQAAQALRRTLDLLPLYDAGGQEGR